jgi:hypothetical protein
MDLCFSVLRGLQARFDEIFELSDHEVSVLQVRRLTKKPPSLLMGHWFSVVRGLQGRFDEVFYLSVRYCTSVRLGRWRGCASCCHIWRPPAEFRP